jgi:hypothetical protein
LKQIESIATPAATSIFALQQIRRWALPTVKTVRRALLSQCQACSTSDNGIWDARDIDELVRAMRKFADAVKEDPLVASSAGLIWRGAPAVAHCGQSRHPPRREHD